MAAKKGGLGKRIFNCDPSKGREADWTHAHAEAGGIFSAAAPVPASKDLRAPWWTIGDQKQTGSCVGWATADGALRWHFVQAKKLDKAERLSPRFLWMASKETDEFVRHATTFVERAGTSIKAALDIARKWGIVPDSEIPFATGRLYQGEEEALYAMASMRRIAGYVNQGKDLSGWKAWIANHGPIVTRLDVDDTWMDAKATGGHLDEYHEPVRPAGHAVALVGYTPDRFIVRNSWGTTNWGDGGFAYASLKYAAAAFTEAYGVTV